MLGVLLLFAFALQIMVGIVSRRSKSSNNSTTKKVLFIRRMHKCLGYLLVVLGKYSTITILKPSHFAYWFVIFWTIPSAGFFAHLTLWYRKAESQPVIPSKHLRINLKEVVNFP